MAAVTIAILADASQATSEMGKVGGAADGMATDLDKADKASRNIGENLDGVASKSSQAAGGLGDLGGALSTIGGDTAIGKLGGAMEGIAPLVMGITGAMDLLTVALDTNVGSWIKNAAASVASKVATVAGTVATAAATAGQWLLNIALSANPIGLIIIGVLLLVGALILLWKKSETFRKIVTAAWEGIKIAAVAVFNFLKGFLTTMFGVFKAIFTRAVAGLKAAWAGIGALFTKVKEIFGNIVSFIAGIPTKLLQLGKDIINGLIKGIQWGIDKVKELVGKIAGLIPDGIKKFLGIGSPSKVLADIGKDTIAGLNQGIEDQIPEVEKAMGGVYDAVMSLNAMPTVDVGATAVVSDAQIATAPAAGAGATYIFNINVSPGTNAAELGRQLEAQLLARRRALGAPLAFV